MARRRPPEPPAAPATTLEDLQRAHTVQLEQLHAGIKVIAERVLESPTRNEINARFDSVDAQLRSLRDDVARKADAAALAALDQRVTLIERRVGP